MGEKSKELKLLDEKWTQVLNTLDQEYLSTLIEAQINKLPHSADIEKWPLIAKKITWEVQHAELDLYVND